MKLWTDLSKKAMDNKDKTTGVGLANHAKGPQGIDKAPGEETSTGNESIIREAQKGKNKVDGDPGKTSDQPLNIDELPD